MQQEANYGLTEQAFGGNQARYAADATLLVRFFKNPKLNEGKSAIEGRPIFEETDYIQIMQPGNKDSIIIRPATPMDKNRFAEHYRKYTARQEQEYVDGTLLSEWPGVTRSQCEELAYFNIKTVEQLAAVSDSNAQKIMGIQVLKSKAAAYLESADGEKAAEELRKQKELNAQLMARLEALESAEEPKKPRRGRKSNAQKAAELEAKEELDAVAEETLRGITEE